MKGLFIAGLLCSACLASGAWAAETAGANEVEQVAAVNINTADAQTLAQALDGVGDAKASAIVAWREKYGDFKSIDELALVKGIGEATVEKNRHKLSL